MIQTSVRQAEMGGRERERDRDTERDTHTQSEKKRETERERVEFNKDGSIRCEKVITWMQTQPYNQNQNTNAKSPELIMIYSSQWA